VSTRSQQRLGTSSLLLVAVAFVAAVVISNQLFKGLRIDLTENNLYTLSDGTTRILESIEEPINLYFYFSDQATEGVPSLRDYANRVREMLEEFADASRGKLRLSVIDPLPFSEDEDRAAQFGLQGVQLGATPDPVYMVSRIRPGQAGEHIGKSRARCHWPRVGRGHGRAVRSTIAAHAARMGRLSASTAAV
jgi:ABC-type uncharacterized transport system involved in gliding motility auxiliary subunit